MPDCRGYTLLIYSWAVQLIVNMPLLSTEAVYRHSFFPPSCLAPEVLKSLLMSAPASHFHLD